MIATAASVAIVAKSVLTAAAAIAAIAAINAAIAIIAIIAVVAPHALIALAASAVSSAYGAKKGQEANFKNQKPVAQFFKNISRHRGKYGMMAVVYKGLGSTINGDEPLKVLKTYKYQNTDGGLGCDNEAQFNDLKCRVLKLYPDVEFI